MPPRLVPGQPVHTPLGKGVITEVRRNGRVLVDVRGRAVLMRASEVTSPEPGRQRRARPAAAPAPSDVPVPPAASPARHTAGPVEIDLHGLRVDEALHRAEQALDEAMRADCPQVRFIHGRSGGRLRAALHRLLRTIPSIRAFRLDPGNPGVTIVEL